MEKRVEVRPIKVMLMCDKCGTEMKRSGGMVYDTYPCQYPYYCEKCGFRTTSMTIYPYLEYGGDKHEV